jgi:hypothetical protein
MNATWASYLAVGAAALAAALAGVVVLLVGRVAELHHRVAGLERQETGIGEVFDLAEEVWCDPDRDVMDIPRQHAMGDQSGVSLLVDSFGETPWSGAGAVRRRDHGQPSRGPGPLPDAPGADGAAAGGWGGPGDRLPDRSGASASGRFRHQRNGEHLGQPTAALARARGL